MIIFLSRYSATMRIIIKKKIKIMANKWNGKLNSKLAVSQLTLLHRLVCPIYSHQTSIYSSISTTATNSFWSGKPGLSLSTTISHRTWSIQCGTKTQDRSPSKLSLHVSNGKLTRHSELSTKVILTVSLRFAPITLSITTLTIAIWSFWVS